MKHLVLLLFFSLILLHLSAAQFYSVTSGDWFDPVTWGMSSDIPGWNDDVFIRDGHTVELVGASSVYINSLYIETTAQPAVLKGPWGLACQLYIADDLLVSGNSAPANLIPGDYGYLNVELGGNLSFNGAYLYQVNRTTFTALSPDISDRRAQLNAYGTGQIQTIFDTSESAVMLEVSSSVSLPEGFAYGFENSRLDPWSNTGFTNCYFSNCTLSARNSTAQNTFNNCHMYSCTANETMYFNGPVAMMDNGNTFTNLTLLNGGSLWGNWGSGSMVNITNNLLTQNGSLVSAGEYGTLTIYLGGDLNVGGQFFPTELYFIGARTEANPQMLTQGPYADVICTTTNSGSTLRLATDFDFNPLLSYIYPGAMYMNNHKLSHAVINSGQMYDEGSLSDCYLNTTEFHGHMTLMRCCINDNNVIFHDDLTLTGGLTGAYGSEIAFTVQGNMYMQNGSLCPGEYGLLNIHLGGNLSLIQPPGATIGFAPTNVYLDGPLSYQAISAAGITLNTNLVAVTPQDVAFLTDISFTPGFNNHVASSSSFRTNFLLSGGVLSNAILDGGNYIWGNLSEVTMHGINGTNLTLGGHVTLADNDNVFYGNTTNNAWLQGAYGTGSTVTFRGNVYNGNFVIPGEWGTLDSYCYGSVGDDSMYPNTWQGTLHLRGTTSRQINFSESIPIVVDDNADFSLTGNNVISSFTIEAGSTLTVPAGAALYMGNIGDYYSGNLVMNGTFGNTRDLTLTDAVYHDLVFHPIILDGGSGTLSVTHNASSPEHLPSSTGEFWSLNNTGSYTTITGSLELHYRGENVYNLRVFYSLDNGDHWSIYSGEIYNDPSNQIMSITTITLEPHMLLAISSLYEDWTRGTFSPENTYDSPLRPHFDWPDLPGGATYHIEISNDDWLSVCYYGSVVSASEYDAEWALAPGTTYRWKVYAISPYLGDIVSWDSYSFHTRAAMTCSLPASSAYLPGDAIMFYMPAFIQNLLLGEPFVVTPYSSAHLQATYMDGTLVITPAPGWTGAETIDLQIADDFTVLNPSLSIVVLGNPANLQLEITQMGSVMSDILSWTAVPGASYYAIYTSSTPEGPWSFSAWAVDNSIVLTQCQHPCFYQVTARTGELPRAAAK